MRIITVGLLAMFGLGGCVNSAKVQEKQTDPLFASAPFIKDGARNQDPQTGPLKGTTLRIKRSLLMVKDLQRSLTFYENVVGFERYAVDQQYSLDQTTIGNKIFNTPYGTRRRIAQLNTSAETRGLALREIDADFDVPQAPRISTLLFEASDLLGILERARQSGGETIGPHLAIVPEREGTPGLRYIEAAIIDPDGHLLTFFKYYLDNPADNAEWLAAEQRYPVDIEP